MHNNRLKSIFDFNIMDFFVHKIVLVKMLENQLTFANDESTCCNFLQISNDYVHSGAAVMY